MAQLTVVGGSSKPPFTVNSRGIAKFKLATRVGARAIVADYAFPDESKPKTITPWPAKQLVLEYYRRGRLEETLAKAILSASDVPPNESRSDRSKRTALLRAAKHLKTFGPTLHFDDVRLRRVRTVISRVPVKVSLDFLATLKTANSTLRLGIIFNVATEVSTNADKLKVYGQVESEIALRVLRDAYPDIDAVWYVDLLTETVVVRKSKPNAALWREIETVCDDMLLLYRDLMSRRARGNEQAN
jgi:hypothetical protein